MSVRLSDEEIADELAGAHGGVLVTLRRDGSPIPLPVWFVHRSDTIYVRTPRRSKKVQRIRHDPRASFLIERGLRWSELTAVMIPATASVLEEGEEFEWALDALQAKYAEYAMDPGAVPEAVAQHYASWFVIKLRPSARPITWSNTKIRATSDR